MAISLAASSELVPDIALLARLFETAGFDVGPFGGYVMPAGTPAAIVERLAAENEKATGTAEVKQRMAQIGFQAQQRGMAEFTAYLKTHWEQLRQVFEANSLRVV